MKRGWRVVARVNAEDELVSPEGFGERNGGGASQQTYRGQSAHATSLLGRFPEISEKPPTIKYHIVVRIVPDNAVHGLAGCWVDVVAESLMW